MFLDVIIMYFLFVPFVFFSCYYIKVLVLFLFESFAFLDVRIAPVLLFVPFVV